MNKTDTNRTDIVNMRPAYWTAEDDARAFAEGWIVSNSSDGYDEIQRVDEAAVFPSDAEALAWVYHRAAAGSDLHRRALLYTMRDGG